MSSREGPVTRQITGNSSRLHGKETLGRPVWSGGFRRSPLASRPLTAIRGFLRHAAVDGQPVQGIRIGEFRCRSPCTLLSDEFDSRNALFHQTVVENSSGGGDQNLPPGIILCQPPESPCGSMTDGHGAVRYFPEMCVKNTDPLGLYQAVQKFRRQYFGNPVCGFAGADAFVMRIGSQKFINRTPIAKPGFSNHAVGAVHGIFISTETAASTLQGLLQRRSERGRYVPRSRCPSGSTPNPVRSRL